MYGWRAKVGHVSPSRGDTLVHEFYQIAPEGVMLLNTTGAIRKIDNADIEKQLANIEERVLDLVDTGADIIFVGGGPGIASQGYEKAKALIRKIEDKAGVPVMASLETVERALHYLNLKTIVLASPYEEKQITRVSDFLEQTGIKVCYSHGLGIRKNTEIGNLPLYTSYQTGKETFYKAKDQSDGLYLPCSRWATLETIDLLEQDIGKPVVSNSVAMIWTALERLNIHANIEGYGSLLRSLGAPGAK